MALKKMVERLTKPIEEQDRDALTSYCDQLGLAAMNDLPERSQVRVGGEVRAVRIVPRAGADALEVTVTDGRDSVTGVFLGRRKIAGLNPGRRVVMEGVLSPEDGRHVLFNPVYKLLS